MEALTALTQFGAAPPFGRMPALRVKSGGVVSMIVAVRSALCGFPADQLVKKACLTASAQIQSDDSSDLSEANARCTVEPGGGESCV
jgi:hypothetical protein